MPPPPRRWRPQPSRLPSAAGAPTPTSSSVPAPPPPAPPPLHRCRAISRDLYEAAALDGASRWKQTWRLTLPLLGRTTTLVVVLQVIASLKIFDQIYLITAGGPNCATRSAIEFIYDTGFTSQRVGYASAASLALFVVILIVSFIWLFLIRKQERGV